MKYLLDTCVVSDFVKGFPATAAMIAATPPNLVAVSSITRMEVSNGLALNPARAHELAPILDDFFSAIETIPFDVADAHAAAGVRAKLKEVGQPIGPYDALIAGVALARGLIVVTSNTQEFDRVGGIISENWR